MNILTRTLLAATLVALPVATVTAQDHKGKPAEHAQDKEKDKKNDGFAVIQVGETMKAIAQTEVDNQKKTAKEAFQKEMDAWKAAKKAAEDKKEKFDKPEPKEHEVKVLKGGFKTMDEANAFIANAEKEKKGKPEEHGKPAGKGK